MTHIRVVDLPNSQAEYVSFLGSMSDVRVGTGGQTSATLSVASITIETGDSIFVGLATNQNSPPAKTAGWTGTDNLGNTYTPQSGPIGNGGLATGLMGCLNATPGVLTSLTISWTTALTVDGSIAMRAHKFRNVGAAEASTTETLTLGAWNIANYVLTQDGSSGGIGIAVMGVRTQGQTGDPYASTGSVYLGSNALVSGSLSDSSGVTVIMAYRTPNTSVGIGQSFASFDASRALAHVGKAYIPA